MNTDFINLIAPGAVKARKEHGICASMTIAQAILESGWGKYAPGNNLFGIKWTEGCGYERQLKNTREEESGQSIYIDAYFRKYDSLADSVYDHAQFIINNSRYSKLLGENDFRYACNAIQKAGYATDSNYAMQLIAIIEQNELWKFDIIEEENDMRKIVTYTGDIESLSAVLVSQKLGVPMMKLSDYEASGLKADEVIQIGGVYADRFETFKNAGTL